MAPGMSSLVVYVGSSDSAIFNAMATANPLNAQLSSSWTWSPADPSTDNPYFQEFAAQGQNLFQAAGDSGRWNSSSTIYPADDAYLTAVGGTDLQTQQRRRPLGFGNHLGRRWRRHFAGQVRDSLLADDHGQQLLQRVPQTYRNGPDVSANANFTFYVCADQSGCTANYYGGTSFAAPMWAGYLALANQQAVANGNPTLGFINPSLYTIGLGPSYNDRFPRHHQRQ